CSRATGYRNVKQSPSCVSEPREVRLQKSATSPQVNERKNWDSHIAAGWCRSQFYLNRCTAKRHAHGSHPASGSEHHLSPQEERQSVLTIPQAAFECDFEHRDHALESQESSFPFQESPETRVRPPQHRHTY